MRTLEKGLAFLRLKVKSRGQNKLNTTPNNPQTGEFGLGKVLDKVVGNIVDRTVGNSPAVLEFARIVFRLRL